MAKRKTGPITTAEGETIRANYPAQSAEAIGSMLDRTPAIVSRWIRDNLRTNTQAPAAKAEIKSDLKRSLKWQHVREEMTSEEGSYFEEQYSSYVQQFKSDILPSEQDQIFNMLRIDIAIHRNRREARTMQDEINRLEDEYRSLPPPARREPDHVQRAREIETVMGGLRAASSARNTEFTKLSSELRSLQDELKATRSQRIDKATTMKESWIDVIKRLQDEDYRSHVGTAAELSKRSTEAEETRLAAWHTFEDGNLDQPILTSETALSDEPEPGDIPNDDD